MAEGNGIRLEDVKRLELAPGQTLVATLPDDTDDDDDLFQRTADALRGAFPGNTVLVLSGGTNLSVVAEADDGLEELDPDVAAGGSG